MNAYIGDTAGLKASQLIMGQLPGQANEFAHSHLAKLAKALDDVDFSISCILHALVALVPNTEAEVRQEGDWQVIYSDGKELGRARKLSIGMDNLPNNSVYLFTDFKLSELGVAVMEAGCGDSGHKQAAIDKLNRLGVAYGPNQSLPFDVSDVS